MHDAGGAAAVRVVAAATVPEPRALGVAGGAGVETASVGSGDAERPTLLRLAGCAVDLGRRIAWRPEPVALTCREAELLAYLAARPGQVVSRDEALREVFGYGDQVVSRAVDNVVRRLRIKIERDPDNPVHLLTEFGVGYRLSLVVAHPAPTSAPAPAPSASGPAPTLALRGGEVDLDAGTIRRPDGVAAIVGNELALLRELVRAAGRPIDAQQLERRVWGSVLARSNRLRSLVWRLRNKIERDPDAPEHLVARRGQGYRFVVAPAMEAPVQGAVRAVVVAAAIPCDPTGEATERLWAAAAEVAAQTGAALTNLAFGQAALVVLGGPAALAIAHLRAAVPGVQIGVADGEVRRVGTAGWVGEAVVRATTRATWSPAPAAPESAWAWRVRAPKDSNVGRGGAR